jgi:hypothetical protein
MLMAADCAWAQAAALFHARTASPDAVQFVFKSDAHDGLTRRELIRRQRGADAARHRKIDTHNRADSRMSS